MCHKTRPVSCGIGADGFDVGSLFHACAVIAQAGHCSQGIFVKEPVTHVAADGHVHDRRDFGQRELIATIEGFKAGLFSQRSGCFINT